MFGYMLYDDQDLVHEVHSRFSAWSAGGREAPERVGLPLPLGNGDVAADGGPLMPPRVIREFFLRHVKMVAQVIREPWIYRRSCDRFPALPDLLTPGMSAIDSIQSGTMDIGRMKRECGDRVAIAGNIDLPTTAGWRTCWRWQRR